MEHWCDHPLGAAPLNDVTMLRFDTSRQTWRDVTGTAAMARALLAGGAPVNGHPDEPEMLDEAGRTPVQLSGIGQLGFPGKPDPAQVEPF